MRIAALDLGSNSFHLLVADVHADGHVETVATEKEMLRLGDEVTRNGRISPAAADRAVATARRLAAFARAVGATEILAKATSAIRSATNGSEIVDRMEADAAIEIEVISGIEEARLIFTAVREAVVIEPGCVLGVDIGGGSVELMVGDAAGLRWAESVPLGVGRLTAELVHDDPPSASDRERLDARIQVTLAPLAEHVRARAPQLCVGTSGTITDLARMAIARATGEVPATTNGLRVTRAQLDELHTAVMQSSIAERKRMPGLDEKRAELLPAGSAVLTGALALLGVDTVVVSDWALREGIVLDAVRTQDPAELTGDPRALRRNSIENLARRCGSDTDHTRHVASLALRIFDQTRDLHGLAEDDRELLSSAVLLHDIGQHVSRKAHHRHAAYLVEHGQLRGFEPHEVELLAALVRHHRRGDPKPSEERFAALAPEDRDRVRKLAALIRVADGLDRGRRGVVRDVRVDVGAELVVLRLTTAGDAELECWGARRRRDLFERVFGRELEVVAASAAPTAGARPDAAPTLAPDAAPEATSET